MVAECLAGQFYNVERACSPTAGVISRSTIMFHVVERVQDVFEMKMASNTSLAPACRSTDSAAAARDIDKANLPNQSQYFMHSLATVNVSRIYVCSLQWSELDICGLGR